MLRVRPAEYGISSTTAFTWAPSRVILLAMMRPISPEPRMTRFLPGIIPSMFTNFCAFPAVNIPAHLDPGILSAPLGRSRQPIASMMALACMVKMPSILFTAVISLSLLKSITMVLVLYLIFLSSIIFIKRSAYSGPVSSSLNTCNPKPL